MVKILEKFFSFEYVYISQTCPQEPCQIPDNAISLEISSTYTVQSLIYIAHRVSNVLLTFVDQSFDSPERPNEITYLGHCLVCDD